MLPMKKALLFQIILCALIISASLYVRYAQSISVPTMSTFAGNSENAVFGFSGNLTFSDLAARVSECNDVSGGGEVEP